MMLPYCTCPFLFFSFLTVRVILKRRRFLRARGFSPAHAQTQFAATQQWRKDHDVDRLYPTFDVDEFEEAKRFYPRWTGRRDKVRLSAFFCLTRVCAYFGIGWVGSMDYRYTYTASLRLNWCRRKWTLYLRRDGINGCTPPSPSFPLSNTHSS